MPPADMAVISLAEVISLKAYSTATSTDMGSESAMVWGSERTRKSTMTRNGSPLPTRSFTRCATALRKISPVMVHNAKRNGPTWIRIRYLVSTLRRMAGPRVSLG